MAAAREIPTISFTDAVVHRSIATRVVHIPSAPAGMVFSGLGQRLYDSLDDAVMETIRKLNIKFRVVPFPLFGTTMIVTLAVESLVVSESKDPGCSKIPGVLLMQTEALAKALCTRLMDVTSQAMLEWDMAEHKKRLATAGLHSGCGVASVSLEGACASLAPQ